MRHFSIKELERLSGIRAHTIRTWEMRYGVFSPQRTITNFRYYTLDDLNKLLDIVMLINKGYRISRLAHVNAQKLKEKIQSFTGAEELITSSVNKLLVLMYQEDVERFESTLDACISTLGIDDAIQSIIVPFLEKANLLSYNSGSSEVHFVVTVVRKKIIRGIESLSRPSTESGSALLFLFKDEHYDLMLLYLNYLLKAKGVRVLYLGTNISVNSLEKVLLDKKPDMLYTYVTAKRINEYTYAKAVAEILPESKLFVCHYEEPKPKSENANVVFLDMKNAAVYDG